VAADRAGGADQRWQRSSTPPERQHFRQSLGWRYDAASRYVRKILSERPSLRAAAAGDDALATDLAAVHVFATSDHTGLLESLRTGAVEQVDRAFVSCVVSGLRRLPTLTGLVVRGGPDDPAAAEAYRRGTDVLEMGLLMAVADSLAEVSGGVEVLIWSSTARRLDGLVEGPEGTKVVFLPGTVFRVLDVDAASEPRRVLLAEMPQNWRSRADAAREERIRDRLRTAAQARTAGPADKNPAGGDPAGGDPAGGDPAGGDPAGGDGWPPPRRRWTSPSLVALPGLAPVQSLRSAA